MNTSESARSKWIAGGASLVILLAVGSMARVFYLQQQATLSSSPQARQAAFDARMALSPVEQERRIELVTRLRGAWKPWADKHQKELRRMLAAKSSDIAARDAVWNAIPITPFQPGGSEELYAALNNGGNGARGEVFTWNPMSRPRATSQVNAMSADVRDRYRREMASSKWSVQNGFSERRDIVISESTQTGKVSVSLWVSGRVTEDTVDDRNLRTSEGFGVFTYKRRELLPPYTFLTSK